MDKNAYFYLTVVVVVAIVLVGAFVFVNTDFSAYKYSVTKNNVDFVSNSFEPKEILSEVTGSDLFIVSPRFVEQGYENSYMVSAITSFSTVLTHKGKKIIIVGRILDGEGNIVECQSNLGDVMTNEVLSPKECEELLADPAAVKVFVEFPEKGLSNSRVLLEKKKLTITPVSFERVPDVSFVVLESLFDDAEEIINNVNVIVDNL